MNTTSPLHENKTELEHFREQTLLEACQQLTAISREVLGMLVSFNGVNPNLSNQANHLFRIKAQLEQVAGVYTQPTDHITISFNAAPDEDKQAALEAVLDALHQRCGIEHVHAQRIICDAKFHPSLIQVGVTIAACVITSGFDFAKEWVKFYEGRQIEVALHGVKLPANDDAAVERTIKILEVLQKQDLERRNQQHVQELETMQMQQHMKKEEASVAASKRISTCQGWSTTACQRSCSQ
jgi:hypothetical protein